MAGAMQRVLQCPPTRLSARPYSCRIDLDHRDDRRRDRILNASKYVFGRSSHGKLTIVTQQELVFAGAEHAHGTT